MGMERGKRKASQQLDFPKKKKKVGKGKQLPDNATVVSFRSQSIAVPAQLTQKASDTPTTHRKQNVQDLLKLLSHPKPSSRCDALNGIRSLFLSHPVSSLPYLGQLMQKLPAVFVDLDESVRHSHHLFLKALLPKTTLNHLSPHSSIIVASIKCGLTHISSFIQLDTLRIIDTFLSSKHAASLLVLHSDVILPLYIPLMSRHCEIGAPAKGSGNIGHNKGSSSQLLSNPGNSLSLHSSWLLILKQLHQYLTLLCSEEETTEDSNRATVSVAPLTLPAPPILHPQRQLVWLAQDDLGSNSHKYNMSDYLSCSVLQSCLKQHTKPVTVNSLKRRQRSLPTISNTTDFLNFTDQLVKLLMECWVEVASSTVISGSKKGRKGLKQKSSQSYDLLDTILKLLCVLLQLAGGVRQKEPLSSSSSSSSSTARSLLSELIQKHQSAFRQHFMTHFPMFESEQTAATPTSILMNTRLCYVILITLIYSQGSSVSSSLTATSVLSYLTSSLPSAPKIITDSAELHQCVSVVVTMLETLLLSPFSQQSVIIGGGLADKEWMSLILGAVVSLFKSCHQLSSAKQALLVFLKHLLVSLVTNPERRPLIESELLQPCLSTLPDLLLHLPSTAPESLFQLVLDLLMRSAALLQLPVLTALHARLPSLLAAQGPLAHLPPHLKSLLLQLIGHIPRLTVSDLTFIARLVSGGSCSVEHSTMLLHIIHHKLLTAAEEAKFSSPGAFPSIIASTISFLFSALIGISAEELRELQLGKESQSSKSALKSILLLAPLSCSKNRQEFSKAVVTCIQSVPLPQPQLLQSLKPSLTQLLSSNKCLPCDAVFSVLLLVRSAAHQAPLPTWLISSVVPLILSCFIAVETGEPNHPLMQACYEESVSCLSVSCEATKEAVHVMNDESHLSSCGEDIRLLSNCLVKLLCEPSMVSSLKHCRSTISGLTAKLQCSLRHEDLILGEQLEVSMNRL